LASGWLADATGLAGAIWTSATLLVLGGTAALLLPNIAARRSSAANSRVTMLRDGVQLLRIPVYRRLLVAATLLEGSHALHDSFSVIRWLYRKPLRNRALRSLGGLTVGTLWDR
jgi:MFS transporter, PPP family, 3-phenylpropionic acid transporter